MAAGRETSGICHVSLETNRRDVDPTSETSDFNQLFLFLTIACQTRQLAGEAMATKSGVLPQLF